MDAVDTNSEFDQLTAEPPTRISAPMSAIGGPPPGWNQSKTNSGTLNVARAQHIVKKLTEDPSWLIDPSTSHAAQSVFGAASKVIGMNIQLESASARSEANKAKNSIAGRVGQSLLKLAETGEVGAGIAAKWYALGGDGKPLYENPANASLIFEDYKAHVNTRVGVAPADAQLLDFAAQYRKNGNEKSAAALEAVVAEHGRNKGQPQKIERSVTVTEVGDDGRKVTRKLTGEEAAAVPVPADKDTAKMLSDYADQKAALDSGDKSVGPDWMGLSDRARKLGELKIKLEQKGINPDTGTRLSTPSATNAPSTSAPPGLQEGQRVRSRVTGKFGTVKNGVVIPDPDPAE